MENNTDDVTYVGRYAPSPTGELHLGNLRTALLAWLHARLQGGQFLLRMEDLDTPRVVAGSDAAILRDLEWLGLDWDGAVEYQSRRTELYQDSLENLDDRGLLYECFCSRKDIQQAASAPHGKQGVYSGACANLEPQTIEQKRLLKAPAIRLRVEGELSESSGDFVIKRADGLFAYQLAVVVDDLEQGVTDVVRGADLLDSTKRQLYLADLLNCQKGSLPRYHHVPLMMDEFGERMSKRDGSMSLSMWLKSGKTKEGLVGLLADSVGLIEQQQSITTEELLAGLSIEQWSLV